MQHIGHSFFPPSFGWHAGSCTGSECACKSIREGASPVKDYGPKKSHTLKNVHVSTHAYCRCRRVCLVSKLAGCLCKLCRGKGGGTVIFSINLTLTFIYKAWYSSALRIPPPPDLLPLPSPASGLQASRVGVRPAAWTYWFCLYLAFFFLRESSQLPS